MVVDLIATRLQFLLQPMAVEQVFSELLRSGKRHALADPQLLVLDIAHELECCLLALKLAASVVEWCLEALQLFRDGETLGLDFFQLKITEIKTH